MSEAGAEGASALSAFFFLHPIHAEDNPKPFFCATAYGAAAAVNRNTAKDSWNVRLKIHDPTGERYFLNFTRKELRISSYESDDILTKVDIWADGVAALN